MNNQLDNLDKKIDWKLVLFLAIVFFSVFLRVYKFDDWLIFKTDQMRDSNMVSHSFEKGPQELPLLGPRAGGTVLRLGPIFYYFEYLATVLIQSTEPPVFAYPNLLFSLLTIPLFYYLSKKYFSRDWSMVLTSLMGVSFLAVEYSRFAWNPNSVPFFTLLFLYSIMEIFDHNQKSKSWWVMLAGASFAITTQLHFSSFITMPFFILAFLAINWKNLGGIVTWKNIAIFLGITLLFYTPVIVSDTFNNGDNIRQFFYSLGTKSSDHTLWSNIKKDIYYFGKYFLRILTGYMGGNRIWHMLTLPFVGGSLLASYALFRKESDPNRKNFILLSVGLFFIYVVVYVPLAYNIDRPRFFLPVLAIPFIFFGFLGEYLLKKSQLLYMKCVLGFIAAVFFFSNTFATLAWFKELGDSQVKEVNSANTIILKAKGDPAWLTWWHFNKAGDMIKNDCKKSNVYFTSSKDIREFDKSLEYKLERIRSNMKIHTMIHDITYNSDACYYYVFRTGHKIPDKISEKFNIEDDFIYGSYAISRFSFKEVPAPKQKNGDVSDEKKEPEKIKADLEDVIEDKKVESAPKPKIADVRKPRVYWKDIFDYFK